LKCSDISERKVKVNPNLEVQVVKLGDTCSFAVTTSTDQRVSHHSGKQEGAEREWTFQSSGKINVLSSYSGPTDSSSTSYKSYQLFPNKNELTLNTNDDGTFSLNLPNGAELFFNKNGSIDQDKTTDLKIKDTPIKLPDFKKSLSVSAYDKLEHLDYKHPKKVKIRVHHRSKYTSLTSRSIGLETNVGMYIPLGISMGKIPGNNANKTYTLFGKNDEKLCSQKMPAHYFFNYLVKCSPSTPNSQCACKYSQDEMFSRINANSALESEIRKLKFRMRNLSGDALEKAKLELQRYKSKYDDKLYSKLYFNCSLDRRDALKFVADKKISGDHREIEGLDVKDINDIYKKLIASNKCKTLQTMHEDCVDCGLKDLINVDDLEKQKQLLEEITDKIQ
jgi:hypothetical protein